jgi:hypothetical protein
MLARKLEIAASALTLTVVPLPPLVPMFNDCAGEGWKRPKFFKDSFFSNKGPRLKISRRMRNRERSMFRAFKNDK